MVVIHVALGKTDCIPQDIEDRSKDGGNVYVITFEIDIGQREDVTPDGLCVMQSKSFGRMAVNGLHGVAKRQKNVDR
ncbi:hypothetical protein AQ768_22195 [Burkholderia pseudomallei]|nr:hypothetical protein AQ768_22195 [Burkholderia pseudomallei]